MSDEARIFWPEDIELLTRLDRGEELTSLPADTRVEFLVAQGMLFCEVDTWKITMTGRALLGQYDQGRAFLRDEFGIDISEVTSDD